MQGYQPIAVLEHIADPLVSDIRSMGPVFAFRSVAEDWIKKRKEQVGNNFKWLVYSTPIVEYNTLNRWEQDAEDQPTGFQQ